LKNGVSQLFLVFKVSIGGFFVAHGFPKSFLVVELRMIGWQIMQLQSVVFHQKRIDLVSFMPPGIIYPKVNQFPFKTAQDLAETIQEAHGVSPGGLS
jgi:hypothetical protein